MSPPPARDAARSVQRSRPCSRRQVLGTALGGAAALGLGGLGAVSCSVGGEDASPPRSEGAGLTRPAAARPTSTAAPRSQPGLTPGVTSKVVVLGSQGGQQITQLTGANVRCGTSVLIDVGGELTVIDCGCGSLHRLAEAGYDVNQVRNLLLSHCHADHVADLGSFATFAWSSGRNGADPNRRLDIYGPTGVKDYEAGLKRSQRRSIADQEGPLGQVPTFDTFATWHELEPPVQATPVFGDDHLDVRAIRVKHGTIPAVGFRVKTADRDIAFSGDRGNRGDDFVDFARGADVLFHEVIDRQLVVSTLRKQQAAPTFIDHLVNDHTDVADAGRVATEAGVSTLVPPLRSPRSAGGPPRRSSGHPAASSPAGPGRSAPARPRRQRWPAAELTDVARTVRRCSFETIRVA